MKAKPLIRKIFYLGGWFLLTIAVVVFIFIILAYNPAALSEESITDRVDRLNEGAAVQVPHKFLDDGKTRAEHPTLFEKVERGEILSDEESIRYRMIYQEILRKNQKYLNRFDWNLTVLRDVEMQHPNNVHGEGIEGLHDHHDESARSNYRGMRDSIRQLSESQSAFDSIARIKYAVSAHKDLTDILLHLATAPQTKSVSYNPPANAPADKFEAIFEDVLREFKLAQFQPVNSADYNRHIVLALNNYDRLVKAVQEDVYAYLTPVERTFAGTWGGWQSLSPSVADYQATRISRKAP